MSDISVIKMEELFGHNLRATYEIITDMEKARAAFEMLIHDMADACLLLDADGRCIWGSQAAADLFDVDQEIIGRLSLVGMLAPAAARTFIAHLDDAQATGKHTAAFDLAVPVQGKIRELSWYLRPFHGVIHHPRGLWVAVGHDVTSLLTERAAKVRLEGEMDTARIIQNALFPSQSDGFGALKHCSFYGAADRCSGDWWGRFTLSPDLELVCIGDVTGHGVGSALVTAVTHGYFTTLVQMAGRLSATELRSPGFILSQLNSVLIATNQSMQMTMFLALIDLKAKTLRYANAGHNFPFLIPVDPKDERIAKQTFRANPWPFIPLVPGGSTLGYAPESRYEDHQLPLRHADRLLFYTDGLIENEAASGKPWGVRQLQRRLTSGVHLALDEMLNGIVEGAKQHCGAVPWADDVTVVTLELDFANADRSPSLPLRS